MSTVTPAIPASAMPAWEAYSAAVRALQLVEADPRTTSQQLADAALRSHRAYAQWFTAMNLSTGLITVAPTCPAFEQAVAEYHAAYALWDELPEEYTNEQADEISDLTHPLRERLMAMPALNVRDLFAKLQIIFEDDGDFLRGERDLILADAKRLATA